MSERSGSSAGSGSEVKPGVVNLGGAPVGGGGSGRGGGETGLYVHKDEVPVYKGVPAGVASGPELAARELAAFLKWEISILNFYHTKCIMGVLAPLQEEVQPRRAAEVELEKRLALTAKGTLELDVQGRAGIPSHAHPLSKRAACHRLYATLKALEYLLTVGKETAEFFQSSAQRPALARVIHKADLGPVLTNIYIYIEAIGLIWDYPTPNRATVPVIYRVKSPAPSGTASTRSKRQGGKGSKRDASTKGGTSSKRDQGGKGSQRGTASKRDSGASSKRDSGTGSKVEIGTGSKRQAAPKRRSHGEGAGAGSTRSASASKIKSRPSRKAAGAEMGSSMSDVGVEVEEVEEVDEEEEAAAAKAASEGGAKKERQELDYVRELELRVFYQRIMAGWLIHEMAELMKIVFSTELRNYATKSRKDVINAGNKLPVNYLFDPTKAPFPFTPYMPFRTDIYKPPF